MARQQRTRSLALALSLLVTASPAVMAQKKKAGDPQDVPERERTVKKERSNMFKKWIDEDVAYIITDEEKKAWKKLATDAEREQFIEAFWRRRDPDPDTEL
ncbi:MAG TPA: GWxTD domain-containing protein, partial [Pyrinomonadaceae bacterium]